MGRDISKTWQCPPMWDDPKKIMGWTNDQVNHCENWLQGQSAYGDIPQGIKLIAGEMDWDPQGGRQRSNLNINHGKYNIRKIVAALADVRQMGMYSTDNKLWRANVELFNKVTQCVAYEGEFPRKLRMALQYMAVTAVGYLWPMYTRRSAQFGDGYTKFEPLGLLDVLPFQLPADNDLQGAYAVTICRFMPVWEAHGKFPEFQAELLPIAKRKYKTAVGARRLDLAEMFKYGYSGSDWDQMYCEIRYTFIQDLSINPTDKVIPMGQSGSSWCYEVPYLGMEIPDGNGSTRAAEPEDCMLYPNRRLIISSFGMDRPISDGPGRDWSGMVPLMKYCADDWPWEASGFSLVHDIYSIERARQKVERGMDQVLKARLDPALGYDRNSGISDTQGGNLDPFEERVRIGVDGDPNAALKVLMPQFLLELPPAAGDWVKYLLESEDRQLGLNEMMALVQLKANMDEDSTEKALELMGPLVQDITYGMECATATGWNMLKYIILQNYSTLRVMQYVGPDGLTPQIIDFDPHSLVPGHMPDEMRAMGKWNGDIFDMPLNPEPSKYSAMQRAKAFAHNLRLVVVPHTMHNITQTQEQLKYLQLYRSGFPIAPHDVAKKLNMENYGDIDGSTTFERWENWQKIQLKLELEKQAAELKFAEAAGLAPGGGAPANGNAGQPPKQAAPGAPAHQEGRPPTAQHPPRIVQKNGAESGPRTTISESGR